MDAVLFKIKLTQCSADSVVRLAGFRRMVAGKVIKNRHTRLVHEPNEKSPLKCKPLPKSTHAMQQPNAMHGP